MTNRSCRCCRILEIIDQGLRRIDANLKLLLSRGISRMNLSVKVLNLNKLRCRISDYFIVVYWSLGIHGYWIVSAVSYSCWFHVFLGFIEIVIDFLLTYILPKLRYSSSLLLFKLYLVVTFTFLVLNLWKI
jgi:hypothetical protein